MNLIVQIPRYQCIKHSNYHLSSLTFVIFFQQDLKNCNLHNFPIYMHDRNSATAVRQTTQKNRSEHTFNTECVLNQLELSIKKIYLRYFHTYLAYYTRIAIKFRVLHWTLIAFSILFLFLFYISTRNIFIIVKFYVMN